VTVHKGIRQNIVRCVNCGHDVTPVRRFNFGRFILLSLFTLFWGTIPYLIYRFLKKSKDCPVCGGNVYTISRKPTPLRTVWRVNVGVHSHIIEEQTIGTFGTNGQLVIDGNVVKTWTVSYAMGKPADLEFEIEGKKGLIGRRGVFTQKPALFFDGKEVYPLSANEIQDLNL